MRSIFQCVLVFLILFPVASWSQELVTLGWDAPTTNTDGSPYDDPGGYRLYIGFEPIPDDKGNAQLAVEVSAEKTTAPVDFTVPPSGAIVYFRILAFDTSGNESALSNQILKDFLPPQGGDDLLLRFLQGVQRVLENILPPPPQP